MNITDLTKDNPSDSIIVTDFINNINVKGGKEKNPKNPKKIKDKNIISEPESAVYFKLINKENGKYTIEILVSNDIIKDEKNAIILDYFKVKLYNEFMRFLKEHPSIMLYQNSNEQFIIPCEEYRKIMLIARKQEKYYNETSSEEINANRVININRGYKIQKYSVDGELLKVYIGIRDASRQETIADTTLKNAIKGRIVYNDFRWMYLDRSLPDNTVQDIGESIYVNTQKNGFVAMLDINKTKIVEVFLDQKTASIARKMKTSASIYHAISRNSLSSGHYFCYYDNCSEELKQDFINKGGILPNCVKTKKGISIQQIDHITGNVVHEYPSFLEIQKLCQMSSKCIKKAINTGEICKGFKWCYTPQ